MNCFVNCFGMCQQEPTTIVPSLFPECMRDDTKMKAYEAFMVNDSDETTSRALMVAAVVDNMKLGLEGLLKGKHEEASPITRQLWEFLVMELYPAVSPKSQYKTMTQSAKRGLFDGKKETVMQSISASDEAMVLTVLKVKWKEIVEEREKEWERQQQRAASGGAASFSDDSTADKESDSTATATEGATTRRKAGRQVSAKSKGLELGGHIGTYQKHFVTVMEARHGKKKEDPEDGGGWYKSAALKMEDESSRETRGSKNQTTDGASRNDHQESVPETSVEDGGRYDFIYGQWNEEEAENVTEV